MALPQSTSAIERLIQSLLDQSNGGVRPTPNITVIKDDSVVDVDSFRPQPTITVIKDRLGTPRMKTTPDNETLRNEMFSSEEQLKIRGVKDLARYVYAGLLNDDLKIAYSDLIVFAGGWFASELQGETPKDYDLFILEDDRWTTENSMTKIKASMTRRYPAVKKIENKYIEGNPFLKEVWEDPATKVQFIFTKHKTREELLKDFDYLHCTVSFHKENLFITRQSYLAAVNKKLIVNNPERVAERRKKKFLERGYTE
jgi:inosine/xanthosine triphosphate pyrophosphatase family protein